MAAFRKHGVLILGKKFELTDIALNVNVHVYVYIY